MNTQCQHVYILFAWTHLAHARQEQCINFWGLWRRDGVAEGWRGGSGEEVGVGGRGEGRVQGAGARETVGAWVGVTVSAQWPTHIVFT